MTLRRLVELWNKFWFEPSSPTPHAIYRILLGLILLQDAVVMRLNDWRLYYSMHPILPINSFVSFWWGRDPRLDVLSLLPQTDAARLAILLVYVALLFFVTIGFHTRLSALCAVILNESFFNQFLLNLSGADVFLKLSLMCIAVSNSGDAFSVDNLRKTFKEDWRKTGFKAPIKPQWAMKMMQVQVAYVYFITSLCKMNDPHWVDGTALYYISRYEDLTRFSMPYFFNNVWITKALTWLSLLFESTFPYLIWIKEFRYFMILWGTMFHIGIDMAVNIPLFEWIFIGAYINYVAPHDLTRVMDWIKMCFRKVFGAIQVVHYSVYDVHQIKWAGVVHRLDIFGRLAIEPYPDSALIKLKPKFFDIACSGKVYVGFEAFRRISKNLPLLWILLPLFYLPGLSHLSRLLFESLLPTHRLKTPPGATAAGVS